MPAIAAVIVTYNPPQGMKERLDAVARQVDHVVIVDNNSDQKAQWHNDNIEIIRNESNQGLAAALNQGIACALRRNAEWVLLLDHDSMPAPDMVERMLAAYQRYPNPERIGLIAPEIKDKNVAVRTRYLAAKGRFCFERIILDEPVNDRVLAVITSGSLIKASTFNNVGLMPEHFFIDYIDYAFCLKMKTRGYSILLVKDAILLHRLGDKKEYSVAGVKMVASHHSVRRRYTIFRNRIWLWKRYAAALPSFVIYDALAASYDALRIALFEEQKWEKYRAILKGICDGVRAEPD
jgi:rhamnosyltransferase